MPKLKITKTTVDAAQPGTAAYELRDTMIPGFLLKVTPAGRKTFMIAYVANNGQRRKPAIGRFGEITVEQARLIAQDWLAEVRKGKDPSLERREARLAPTVKELFERFMTEYSEPRNKASRVSDALGAATEMRAMKNYAGNRLSPWLGHLMVSRQETARPLLTPGEVMQLPPEDELVLVSGCHPLRAKKARYYEDGELQIRILPPPRFSGAGVSVAAGDLAAEPHVGDWPGAIVAAPLSTNDPANAGIRREPDLPVHEDIAPATARPVHEFEQLEDEPDDEAQRLRAMQRNAQRIARQVTLDPADDMGQ